jgi:hypothetical protein
MTAGKIDSMLMDLARASDALLQDSQAEDQRADEMNDLSEAMIEQRAKGREGRAYDHPDSVLLSARLSLANKSALRHRRAAREFVSWWADAATVAWRSAVMGTPVQRTRLVASAPHTMLTDEELAELPSVDEDKRQLVEMATLLGVPSCQQPADGDESPTDLAARYGLRLQSGAAGDIKIVDGNDPEDRRCRLWGDFWIEHQVPKLPEPDELKKLLRAMPAEAEERIRGSIRAVVQAMIAAARTSELEDRVGDWTAEESDEYERLTAQADSLTIRLADYARAVTDSLR